LFTKDSSDINKFEILKLFNVTSHTYMLLAEGYWRCVSFYLVAHLIASGVDSLERSDIFGYLEPTIVSYFLGLECTAWLIYLEKSVCVAWKRGWLRRHYMYVSLIDDC
jgi:hypothetical protein